MRPGAILWILTVCSGIDAEFTVIQNKSSVVATEGETVILPCRHNATGNIWSSHWFKDTRNGTEVTNETAEYRGRFFRLKVGDPFTKSVDVSMQLKDVQLNDSGLFFCKVKTMHGEACGAGTYLTVRGKSRSFTVKQGQSSLLVGEGQTVFMLCTHTANHSRGSSSYSWHKNDRNASRVSTERPEYAGRVLGPDQEDSFNASMKLMDVRESDSGVYYCKVQIDGLGEGYGEGVRLTVSHANKRRPTKILLLILVTAAGVEGSILLASFLFCRQTCRAKNTLRVQRQEPSTLNVTTTAADPTLPLLDEGPEPTQDGNSLDNTPPWPEFKEEDQMLYLPMQGLMTFNTVMDNGTDVIAQSSPVNSPISYGWVPTADTIHYAVIYQGDSEYPAPPKTSVEDGDLEQNQDQDYDELNVTAKHSLSPEENTNQQEEGVVSQHIEEEDQPSTVCSTAES